MRAHIGLALASVVLVSALPASAEASSAPTTIVSKTDKRGDVKILKSKAISKSKKKTIDIQRAAVQRLSNGKIRFKVRIKKIVRTKKWDQMVFFSGHNEDNGPYVYSSIGFKIRNSGGAYASQAVTDNVCTLKVRRSGRYAWVDVPRSCAPVAGEDLVVSTVTGHYQTDEDAYSSDQLKLGPLPTF
jgi:hypothetical protein